jgi:hypothetical protein
MVLRPATVSTGIGERPPQQQHHSGARRPVQRQRQRARPARTTATAPPSSRRGTGSPADLSLPGRSSRQGAPPGAHATPDEQHASRRHGETMFLSARHADLAFAAIALVFVARDGAEPALPSPSVQDRSRCRRPPRCPPSPSAPASARRLPRESRLLPGSWRAGSLRLLECVESSVSVRARRPCQRTPVCLPEGRRSAQCSP